ncbi:hypothetical protein [Acinetobacter populi]|uniref:Uncharacterized protein n=1 Tax=Acinetobacter populi TaxID=1582270 RepID=A0A1Z9YUI2_9GAMM|nr:hypothetical protein [Acinetobacter populi]OUY05875.1 hypothetical protein CAP51_14230 [Acinetobacter populi]
MKFILNEIFSSKINQYLVLVDEEKKYYVGFLEPTFNRMSEYWVYFKVPNDLAIYTSNILNENEVSNFVQECINGKHKDLKLPFDIEIVIN